MSVARAVTTPDFSTVRWDAYVAPGFRLIGPAAFPFRVYGLRTLVNTWAYATTGRRLPGFFGDTLYQSERRLTRYYRQHGLVLRRRTESKSFLGRPVFLYHTLEKAVA